MQHVQAVDSAFALLEHIASLGGNATLSQISEDLGMSAASTHRRLRTLVHLGYARQLHNRSYALGFGLIRLGEVATGQHISAMQPILASAASQLGETVTLAMLEGDMINHALQAQSPHGLRSTAELGISSFAHETPAGTALLAQLPGDQMKRTLARANSRDDITSDAGYRQRRIAAIRKIKRDGYVIDNNHESGLRCYAVPVLWAGIPLALSVIGPIDRLSDSSDNRVVTILQQAALRIVQESPSPLPPIVSNRPSWRAASGASKALPKFPPQHRGW